jgi:hypothetical protein
LKTTTKLGAGVSLAFVFAGMIANSTVANAAPVQGCGKPINEATPTDVGDYCQYMFIYPEQTFNFVVPAGVISLQALLVGAGAGAGGGFGNTIAAGFGYSGDGGSVRYVDLSSSAEGDSITIKVGAGSATMFGQGEMPAKGGDTQVGEVVAPGGQSAGSGGVCAIGSTGGYFYGSGAAGVPDGEACSATGAPGIYPSADSNSLSLFKDLTPAVMGASSLGNGGIMASTPVAGELGPGWGAWVASAVDVAGTAAAKGGDGLVIVRYVLEDIEPEAPEENTGGDLADTGTSEEFLNTLGSVAAGSVVLGAGMVLASRRRKSSV